MKGFLEDQYAGKATNDVVGAMTAFLKDSPRVNPKKSSPLQAIAQVPQVSLDVVAHVPCNASASSASMQSSFHAAQLSSCHAKSERCISGSLNMLQVHGAAGDSLSAASASLRALLSLPAQASQVSTSCTKGHSMHAKVRSKACMALDFCSHMLCGACILVVPLGCDCREPVQG